MKTNRRSFLALLGFAPIASKAIALSEPKSLPVHAIQSALPPKPEHPILWRVDPDIEKIRGSFGEVTGLIVYNRYFLTRDGLPKRLDEFHLGCTLRQLAIIEGVPDGILRMLGEVICTNVEVFRESIERTETRWTLESFQRTLA